MNYQQRFSLCPITQQDACFTIFYRFISVLNAPKQKKFDRIQCDLKDNGLCTCSGNCEAAENISKSLF